jgi:hypothetical protein
VGCEWIIAEGTIEADTPARFEAFLRKHVSAPLEFIKFNSPGGNVLAAIKLGELIRGRKGLMTEIGKTVGTPSGFDADTIKEEEWREGICASACVYAFLGGTTRFTAKSKVGVHQFYTENAMNDPGLKTATAVDRSVDQLLTGILLEYSIRMGADPRLISVASTVPPWEPMKWLTEQELSELGIDNSRTTYSTLSVEPFGRTGSYVETTSRSFFYSFRHRLYCKGSANAPHIAFLATDEHDFERRRNSMVEIISKSSIVLSGEQGEKSFPLKVAAVEISNEAPRKVQVSAAVVGASMSDFQSAARAELRSDQIGRSIIDVMQALSFDLKGDRRKVGIAARSCVL